MVRLLISIATERTLGPSASHKNLIYITLSDSYFSASSSDFLYSPTESCRYVQ